jgi:hypothetical protein
MPFASLTHKSLVESFDGLDEWLSSKGVSPRGTDRIHQLLEVVRTHNPRVLGPVLQMTQKEQRQYMFALAELLEFHQIAAWLRDENPAILGPKLDRALSGSVDPAEETLKNSDGRNTMFELSLAAEWRRAGLNIEIGEPDIQLTVGNQKFLVECKRPFTWTGIVSCLRHAKRQLRENGISAEPGAPKGVIAVSLNRVISAGEQLFFAESLADRTKVGDLINSELEFNRWRWFETIRFDESMAAVAFHLNLPAGVDEGPQFALMSSLNGYKASPNEDALTIFREAMSYGSGDAFGIGFRTDTPG